MENPDLVAIIAQLREVRQGIQERRLAAASDEERQRLKLEYNGVNRRILSLQAVLFDASTQDIAADVADIRQATAEVKRAIKEINDLNAALGGIANLLGIVDKVLGLFP